jgi:hypothetical protein
VGSGHQGSKSDASNHPVRVAILPNEYTLTGGGAFVDWKGEGNLLTASFPNGNDGWEVRSKDHTLHDPSPIHAYAIGIKPKPGNTKNWFTLSRPKRDEPPSSTECARSPRGYYSVECLRRRGRHWVGGWVWWGWGWQFPHPLSSWPSRGDLECLGERPYSPLTGRDNSSRYRYTRRRRAARLVTGPPHKASVGRMQIRPLAIAGGHQFYRGRDANEEGSPSTRSGAPAKEADCIRPTPTGKASNRKYQLKKQA